MPIAPKFMPKPPVDGMRIINIHHKTGRETTAKDIIVDRDLTFLKIRRFGERFWVQVISRKDDGSLSVRCANDTIGPESPRMGERFVIGPDDEVIDVDVRPRVIGKAN